MIPLIVAGIAGLSLFLAIDKLVKPKAPASGFAPPPDFKNSPPATQALPPGRSVTGLPVITADQFAKQSAESQANIRAEALKGILTLSATNGTLFAEKPPEPAEAFIGAFKPNDDLKGLFIVADPALSRRFGVPLPIPDGGNMILEALESPNGRTFVPSISRDPRAPDVKLNIPLNAITGAGDP